MATRVFDGIKFCEHFLKKTSQGTFLPSLVQIGPVVWEEKMLKKLLTMHDGHLITLTLSQTSPGFYVSAVEVF